MAVAAAVVVLVALALAALALALALVAGLIRETTVGAESSQYKIEAETGRQNEEED